MGPGKEEGGPQGAVASAASICVSGGTVGRCGIARIGSSSTVVMMRECQDAKRSPFWPSEGIENVSDHIYRVAVMYQMMSGVQLDRFYITSRSLTIASLIKRHERRRSAWH